MLCLASEVSAPAMLLLPTVGNISVRKSVGDVSWCNVHIKCYENELIGSEVGCRDVSGHILGYVRGLHGEPISYCFLSVRE